jgi:hypothetical protein
MDVTESIDVCSDDVTFLEQAKRALEAQNPESTWENKLRTASFCRIRAIIMVASIEHLIAQSQNDNNRDLLQTYLTGTKRVPNRQRVQALCEAFQRFVPVDPDIFADYLGIKFLRNTIVHGEWHEQEQAYVQERGFPIDTRLFTEEHWQRMQVVEQKLAIYITASRS